MSEFMMVSRPRDVAIQRILSARCEQIERFGHTPESDLVTRPTHLPEVARAYCVRAIEDLQFSSGPQGRTRALADLAKAGATILAAIDRLLADETRDGEKYHPNPTGEVI